MTCISDNVSGPVCVWWHYYQADTLTISGSLRKHHTYMQYIIKWSLQHKSVSHLENNCKSLWAKWYTNFILDVFVARWKLSYLCVRYCSTLSGSSLDELTDHRTSWNDEFAQILKLPVHWQPSWKSFWIIKKIQVDWQISVTSLSLYYWHQYITINTELIDYK